MPKQTVLSEKQKTRELIPLVAECAELDANIKAMQAELADKKDRIKELKPSYGVSYLAPGAEMVAKPFRTLNKGRAEQRYGDHVKELVVTPDAVRKYLADESPAKIAELYDESISLTFRYVGEQ